MGLSAIVVASLRLNAETWLDDYPPDIREAFGAMSEKARRQRIPFAILFGSLLLAAVAFGLGWLFSADGAPGSGHVFVYFFVVFTTFNLIDLILLDWLWFVRFQPDFVVLPGTRGLAGYADYSFHFRAFLKGVAGTIVVALLVAGGAVGLRLLA